MFLGRLEMFSCSMAIDVGTSFTRAFVRRRGVVLNQPTIVATSRNAKGREHYDVGFGAAEMLGRAPPHIEVVRPFRDGVIADFDVAQRLVKAVIRAAARRWTPFPPSVIVCVPHGSTVVERRALKEAAESAGVRTVLMIEAPMSAAVGEGAPVTGPRGSMVIDIGGGTTEIALISLGEIVHCRSLRVGGDKMTEAIQSHLRRRHNVHVGESLAEKIKREIGSAMPPANQDAVAMEVACRDIASGLPKRLRITETEIHQVLAEVIAPIGTAIRSALENISPEFAEDLSEKGLILTGGGALLRGMDALVRQFSNVAVSVPEHPMLSVVTGAGRSLENLRMFPGALARAG